MAISKSLLNACGEFELEASLDVEDRVSFPRESAVKRLVGAIGALKELALNSSGASKSVPTDVTAAVEDELESPYWGAAQLALRMAVLIAMEIRDCTSSGY